jgi:hypothetical protein
MTEPDGPAPMTKTSTVSPASLLLDAMTGIASSLSRLTMPGAAERLSAV